MVFENKEWKRNACIY